MRDEDFCVAIDNLTSRYSPMQSYVVSCFGATRCAEIFHFLSLMKISENPSSCHLRACCASAIQLICGLLVSSDIKDGRCSLTGLNSGGEVVTNWELTANVRCIMLSPYCGETDLHKRPSVGLVLLLDQPSPKHFGYRHLQTIPAQFDCS